MRRAVPQTAPEVLPLRARRLHPAVWVAGLVSLLTDVASEMIYPVLPLFLTARLGAPAAALGLIEGVAETVASTLKAPAGWWSDRLGRRKPLMVLGYGLSNLTRPLFALASGWPHVLLLRAADRFGKGVRGTPRDALIADLTPPEARGRAFGLHRTLDTVGAVLGPLCAYALLARAPQDYARVFVWSALPAGLAVLALVALLREPARAGERAGTAAAPAARGPGSASGPAGWVPALRRAWVDADPRLRRFLAATGLFALGNSSDAFLVLRARDLGLADAHVPLAYLAFTASYALLAYPAGALSDRLGRRPVLVGGYLVFAAVYAGFALARTPAAVWPLFLAYGAYYAAVEGVQKAYAADLSPPDRRGAVIGAVNAATGLGALPASLVAGALWDAFGPAVPFALGAATALGSAVLLARRAGGPEAARG